MDRSSTRCTLLLSLILVLGGLATGCDRQAGQSSPLVSSDATEPRQNPARDLRADRRPSATRPSATRPAPMRPERTLDFAYHDKQLLAAGQRHGGRVWVPRHRRRRRARLPMVVVMHGIDKTGERMAHRLLGGAADIRPTVRQLVQKKRVQPVLLAAPSQTRKATGASTLWTPRGFDLASFVTATERRLSTIGVEVDRTRLAVVGHSGAGCYLAGNTGNGLFHLIRGLPNLRRRGYRIQWVGFMDTCFFGGYGAHWLRRALRGTKTRVAAMWTGPAEWGRKRYRRVRDFTRAIAESPTTSCDAQRYTSCRTSRNGWWIMAARRKALRRSFGDRSGSAHPINPHWGVTRWFMEELLTRWLPA